MPLLRPLLKLDKAPGAAPGDSGLKPSPCVPACFRGSSGEVPAPSKERRRRKCCCKEDPRPGALGADRRGGPVSESPRPGGWNSSGPGPAARPARGVVSVRAWLLYADSGRTACPSEIMAARQVCTASCMRTKTHSRPRRSGKPVRSSSATTAAAGADTGTPISQHRQQAVL